MKVNFSREIKRKIPNSLICCTVVLMCAMFVPITFRSQAIVEPAVVTSSRPLFLENYDIRTVAEAAQTLAAFRTSAGKNDLFLASEREKFSVAESNLRRRVPTLKVEYNEDLKIPEVIAPDVLRGTAFLTEASTAKNSENLRRFLKENAELIGLAQTQIDNLLVTADYTNSDGVLSFAHLEQQINGIPVFRGEVKAGFTKRGEIIRVINNLAPALDEASLSKDFGASEQAVRNAFSHVVRKIKPADTELNKEKSNDLRAIFGAGDSPTVAEKMYFPTEIGTARAAWRVLIWEAVAAYYVIVDAETGELLWRKNITNFQTQPATYNVYYEPNNLVKAANNPAPLFPGPTNPNFGTQGAIIPRQNVTVTGNEPPYNFNNLGWIADGQNITDGNNVEAGIDRDGEDGVDAQGKATGSPNRNFIYNYTPGGAGGTGEIPAPPTQTYPPTAYQNGSITNLFYTVNRWHDELYLLGFTEQARNFQQDNFGRGGLGGDRIRAEAQDSSGVNNANMATPADGDADFRGRMQMYLWDRMTPNRDGSLDNEVVIHELTHGLSNRLHGNASGLSTPMSAGMGEGWSDFYAIVMLAKNGDSINAVYPVGGYVSYNIFLNFTGNYYYGIRRFPRAVRSYRGANNRPHDPLTFADVDPEQINLSDGAFIPSPRSLSLQPNQVHNAGEIWSGALWEIRSRMVERLGHNAGTRRSLQFVTDGMKLAPLNPTFLQERDAIVAAATASGTAVDLDDVWRGFAIRGMGVSARILSQAPAFVDEGFDVPNLQQSPAYTFSDAATGNNNGAADPGETIILTVPLTNPTTTAAANATLQIGVSGAAASYGTIAGGATVSRQLNFTVPANAVCGSVIQIPFKINSSLGAADAPTELVVGKSSITFAQNFDASTNLPAGWTTSITGAGFNWTVGAESPSSPPNSIYTFAVAAAGSASLVTPAINVVSQSATLRFRHRFFAPPGDGGVLEISIGGAEFTDIRTAGGKFLSGAYNGVLGGSSNPIVNRRGWSNNSNGYLTTEVRLPATAAGNSVRLRWRAAHNNDGTGGDRWIIDDVQLFDNFACTNTAPTKARADFDGDGKSDVSVYRSGSWFAQRSTQGFIGQSWGAASDVATPGDFDGDGKTDFAVFRPGASAAFFVLNSQTNTVSIINWGTTGDIPVNGDFNADGRDDFAVFRSSTGSWFVLPANGGAPISTQFGANGDKPVSGDFDGDAKADFAVFRGGNWFILQSSNNQFRAVGFGFATDKPVAADYDNDNKTDIAVYRPDGGSWFILRSSNGAFQATQFGIATDTPAPADFDGDGADDIAVFRGGVWYLLRSQAGFQSVQFGVAADAPVPARYLP